MILSIRVYGRPAPEGSHEVGANGHVMHSSTYLKSWRAAVDRDVRRAYLAAGLTGADMPLIPYPLPVYLLGVEILVGPEQCRAAGTDEPTGSPDLDKLLRATIDGLGDARAFGNDSQVTKVFELGKRRDPEPGAVIIISDEAPTKGDTMTEYRLTLERVTGRDADGFRETETVLELHGTAGTISTAGLTTIGALLGAAGVSVSVEPTVEPATAPAPEPAKTRRPRKATAPAPETAPAVVAEHAEQEREAARGDEVAPAPAAPVNPFARP